MDFYMEKGKQKYLMEVKGCTLEIDGVGYFPDARRKEAKDAGVEVLSLKCHVGMDRLEII